MCSNLRLLKLMPRVPICLFPEVVYSPPIAVIVSIAASSVNDAPTLPGKVVFGWRGGRRWLWEKRADQTLSPDEYCAQQKTTRLQKRVTFNAPFNPQQDCFSWEEIKGGKETFRPTKYFLVTLTLWNNKPFVQTMSVGHTVGGVFFFFWQLKG